MRALNAKKQIMIIMNLLTGRVRLNLFKVLMMVSLSLILGACSTKSDGTATGNPVVTLNISPFNSSLMSKPGSAVMGKAGAMAANDVGAMAVSDLRMCFKRLRFKTQGESTNGDSSTDSDNIDLNLGEVSINNAGTSLGVVNVPAGTYSRVEFDLENNCSGYSVRVVNSSGTFTTTSRVSIRFEGTLVVSGTQTVNLNIQAIVSALNTVTSNGDVRNKAESASGSL